MRFPKERLRFSKSEDGRTSGSGFLILDLKGLDIEGAVKFVIDFDHIEAAKRSGDIQTDAMKEARALLGG